MSPPLVNANGTLTPYGAQLVTTATGEKLTRYGLSQLAPSGVLAPETGVGKYGLINGTGNGTLLAMPGNGGLGYGTAGGSSSGPGMPSIVKNLAPDNIVKNATPSVHIGLSGFLSKILSDAKYAGVWIGLMVLAIILIVSGLKAHGVKTPPMPKIIPVPE